MKVIVAKQEDGTCLIIYPAPEMFDPMSRTRVDLSEQGIIFENDDEVLAWIRNKDVPAGLESRITDLANIPANYRMYREAWTDDNTTDTVDVDIDKAKEIQLDKFRELRKPKLEALDIEYLKAQEADDAALAPEVVAKKQVLRDITLIALPDTIEELKDYIPEVLK